MKNPYKCTLLAVALLTIACNEEPFISDGTNAQSNGVLQLRISADDFTEDSGTRVEDKGSEIKFERGDRVGVLILRQGKPTGTNNLPYVFDGTEWVFDTQTAETENTGKTAYSGKGIATLTVYYPYDEKADDIFDEKGLKAKFQPLSDQHTEEDYRRSDLMACTATVRNLVLDVRLSHLYASFSLRPSVEYVLADGKTTRIEGLLNQINLTVGNCSSIVPYRTEDGCFRYILPNDFSSGEIRWFYSCGTATYGGSRMLKEVKSNVRYSQIDRMDCGKYGYEKAKIGDYYCTTDGGDTGYLLPAEAAHLLDQHRCVGIVFQTDPARIGDAEKEVLGGKVHALALAVRNAPCHGGYGDASWWGKYGEIEEDIRDCTTLADNYADLSGLHNTETILSSRATEIDELGLYQAFKAVQDYRISEPLPTGTTDWFLPSAGQWWDVLQFLGKAPTLAEETEQTSTESNADGWVEQGDIIEHLNGWLSVLAAEDKEEFVPVSTQQDISNGGYWTSTEYSFIYAIKWLYQADEKHLYMSKDSKQYNGYVRCAFAF